MSDPRADRKKRFAVGSLLAIGFSLELPALATIKLSRIVDWRIEIAYLLGISLMTVLAFRKDKRQAQRGAWRTPETSLHLAEALGGWVASFFVQRLLPHKISKSSYQLRFWSIVALYQLIALDCLLDWPVALSFLEIFDGSAKNIDPQTVHP